jgi:hypothetical protein
MHLATHEKIKTRVFLEVKRHRKNDGKKMKNRVGKAIA